MQWLKAIIGFILITIVSSKPALAEKVSIAVGDWPPYLSEQLKHNGIIGHLLHELFKEAGYELTLSFYPWSRADSLGKIAKQDMTGVWMLKPEREEDFHYGDPVLNEQFVFFHLKTTHFHWQTLNDLKGWVIGGGQEYSYGAEFDNALEAGDIIIERVPTKQQNWRKLLLGRIALYPEELNVGYSSLKQIYPKNKVDLVTHHPKALLNNLSYLLFPKKSDKSLKLIKDFNKQLKVFRESGRYETYFKGFREGYYEE